MQKHQSTFFSPATKGNLWNQQILLQIISSLEILLQEKFLNVQNQKNTGLCCSCISYFILEMEIRKSGKNLSVGIISPTLWLQQGWNTEVLCRLQSLGVTGGANSHTRICVRVSFAVREGTVTPTQDSFNTLEESLLWQKTLNFLSFKYLFLNVATLSCCSIPSSELPPFLWGTSDNLQSCSGR